MNDLINYRQPNIERFLEIMAASSYHFSFSFHLKDITILYDELLQNLKLRSVDIENADFFCQYVKPTPSQLFSFDFENFEDLKARALKEYALPNLILESSSKSLLQNAYEKLDFMPEKVEKIIKLSAVIAAMDNKKIGAEHIAESIQYSYL